MHKRPCALELVWDSDNLDYAEGWTWFDGDGNALSDEEVATMTSVDKAEAFLEGRYAKGASSNGPGDMMGGRGDGMGDLPDGNLPDGELPADMEHGQMGRNTGDGNREMIVGTPDAGTTQAAGSAVDSNNYATYEEMVAA